MHTVKQMRQIEKITAACRRRYGSPCGDSADLWLAPRIATVLRSAGINTLADLTLRVPRRRRWWVDSGGLDVVGARRIEAFFAAHPDLTDRARALVVTTAPEDVVAWEKIGRPCREWHVGCWIGTWISDACR